MSTKPVTGFILAGGKSRRMGFDKASLDWGGQPLIDHMAQLISTVAAPVRIVGRQELPDMIPETGPVGGILTALRASETEDSIVTAVDLPLLTPEFLSNLRGRLETTRHRIVACRIGSDYPLCLGLRRSLLDDVEQAIRSGRYAVWTLIESCDAEIITDAPAEIFQNLNTLDDYHRSLARWKKMKTDSPDLSLH
jgi:molybdopterin-guanine dinucleotide biosynthesis protein A